MALDDIEGLPLAYCPHCEEVQHVCEEKKEEEGKDTIYIYKCNKCGKDIHKPPKEEKGT